MCKSIKNSFDEKLTFDNLYDAYLKSKNNKSNKESVLRFEMNLEVNLMNLYNELKHNKYKIGKYKEFIIYEPKERIIKALPFRDRIVQTWYIEEFIKQFIVKRFIKDSYACLIDKGTHKAIKILQKYMQIINKYNKNYYILKCDIKKYFYSIDKDILFNIMKDYISDNRLLDLTKTFIYDDTKVGLPIGNYTSQFYANIYLDKLDHYIKEELKIKYYVRYMDDFILLLNNKDECIYYLDKIDKFVKSIKLELNRKTRYYPNELGIDFCGYVIYNNYIKLRKRNKKKIYKLIKKYNYLYLNNKLDKKKFILSYNSYKGLLNHCNSYNLVNEINNKIMF